MPTNTTPAVVLVSTPVLLSAGVPKRAGHQGVWGAGVWCLLAGEEGALKQPQGGAQPNPLLITCLRKGSLIASASSVTASSKLCSWFSLKGSKN